jgi:hypothetical protein
MKKDRRILYVSIGIEGADKERALKEQQLKEKAGEKNIVMVQWNKESVVRFVLMVNEWKELMIEHEEVGIHNS